MNVVYKKSILKHIETAIKEAEETGRELDHIMLTPTEAKAFMRAINATFFLLNSCPQHFPNKRLTEMVPTSKDEGLKYNYAGTDIRVSVKVTLL